MQDEVKFDVKHYYFTSWPDHGVPSDTTALIEFCKVVRSERKTPDGTIVVHCRFA
jgi:protein tyrosine phosphatase